MRKYTIRDFDRQFPDEDSCLEWLRDYLWPAGISCKNCQRVTKHYRVATRPSYSCEFCGNHVHPMAGTIYEKSTTPLRLWFHAIFLLSSTRCGISAKQLEREIGVTYKTAWRMFDRIRKMLDRDVSAITDLSGSVEVDETYVGGRKTGTNRGRSLKSRTPVFGLAERKGRVAAKVVPNVQAKNVLPVIIE